MPQKSKKSKKKDAAHKRKSNLEAEKCEKVKQITTKASTSLKGPDNFFVHFSKDELQEIKTIIHNKDLSNVPLMVAAVIVNKLQIIKDLLQKGCHINETDPNHLTALMWAVKSKNTPIIDFLLANGADPTTKNDSGDNILFMALESKLWDQKDYISLWNRVTNVSFVDVDFKSKSGRNMVHQTIRREWEMVLDILIAGKANINSEIGNGTTPLMMASYLNNFHMVNSLLQANADVLKQDINGCTALCYAISGVINKEVKSPLLVVDKLKAVFYNHDVNFRDFFVERIHTILHTPVKQNKAGQVVLDMKTYLIHYVLKFMEHGLEMTLQLQLYKRIAQAAETYIKDPLQMIKFLIIVREIMKYCIRHFGAGGLNKLLLDAVMLDGLVDMCFRALKLHGLNESYDYDFITNGFGPILNVCVLHSEGKAWLNNHYFQLLPYHKMYLEKNPIDMNTTDVQKKEDNEKILEFNKLMDTIREEKESAGIAQPAESDQKAMEQDSEPDLETPQDASNENNSTKEFKQDQKSNPKKTKRRAKAFKAKLAKIKSADLAERLNQNGKKLLEQKCVSDTSVNQTVAQLEESSVAIQEQDLDQEDQEEIQNQPQYLNQNRQLELVQFEDLYQEEETINGRFKLWSHHTPWEQIWFVDNTDCALAGEFGHAITMLESQYRNAVKNDLFNINFEFKTDFHHQLRREYEIKEIEENNEFSGLYPDWKTHGLFPPSYFSPDKIKLDKKRFPKSIDQLALKEKPSEEEIKDLLTYTLNYLSGLLKKIIITYQKHWEQDKERDVFMNDHGDVTDQFEKKANISLEIEKLEIEHIQHVQKQFDNLIKQIKKCAEKNFLLCSRIIDKLESILLNHKIRGKSIIQDTVMQVVNINDDWDEALSNLYEIDQDIAIPKSVENLLTQTRSGNYINDDNASSHKEQNPDALYLKEILALPPKPIPNMEQRKRNKLKTMKNAYHLVPSILNICEESYEIVTKKEEMLKQETSKTYKKRQTLQQTLLAMPKIDDPNRLLEALEINCNSDSFMEATTSRWCSTIRSLQMMKCYQILLNGEIRISNKNKDDSHTISSGGNFSPVILGLDVTDRPLAVKRIRKDSSVCKIMKTLLNPLLGLRNTNLLHYFSCNYEENELVLATPLCEYNMGEYIMIMKRSPNLYVSSIDIVKQFLAGLRFLHDRMEPIIHGNLKPSNIFIDLNGIVRIAEFGMHKALYTITQAPNTSIIWFSRETFVAFKEVSSLTCTCASDIQVAGMLIHFMLTAGKHPYGEIMQDILKNLERATPQLATPDVDLHDLISWMLLYEPGERPTINQVLSHVFFWTIDRKWRFILTCSGVSSHGTPLNLPLNELHLYINLVAARENIKGRWINITKAKFPNLSYSKDDLDSITGLLRFIRNCMQNQTALHINSDLEFRNFILSSFPALPLSLYRILECSQWLNHRALQPFTTVDSLSA